MNDSKSLVKYLIQHEIIRDKVWRELHQKLHMSENTVGESSMLFHLKALLELIDIEYNNKTPKVSFYCKLIAYFVRKILTFEKKKKDETLW